jgi:hypothetical protein
MLSTVTSLTLTLTTDVSNVAHPQFHQFMHWKGLFQCAHKWKKAENSGLYSCNKGNKGSKTSEAARKRDPRSLLASCLFELSNLFGNCQHILAWMIGWLIKSNWKWFWRRPMWPSRAGPTKTVNTLRWVISGFRREVEAICALLGHYAAYSGGSLPTFRDKPSFPSSKVRISWAQISFYDEFAN